MNIGVIIIELAAIAAVFSAIVVTTITKNPESMVTDYPPDIREVYYRTHEEKKEKLTKGAIVRKIVAMLIYLFAYVWMAHIAGADTFVSVSLIIFLYVVWMAAFDTFVLDWIFFPRVKKWRLPGTENMDKEYAQKWFHLKGALQVAPLGIVYALLGGLISMLIF